MKYVVITPVRDEEDVIVRTLDSMLAQTERPVEWVLVDDGSTDRTGAILDDYASEHPWMRVVHREDRGFRDHIHMEAFYAGFDALQASDWELLVKFDGDLEFEPSYFERCLAKFAEDPKLGIGGGLLYNRVGGELLLERHPNFHVRGATKMYRRECWDSIDGLIRLPGWDTLDEVHANMKGWSTRSFEDVTLIQQRDTGEANGQWPNWIKNGRANYAVGYHPLFLLARSVVRVRKPPYLVASAGLVYGYVSGYLTQAPRIEDLELRSYLRRQQMAKLTGRPTIWK